MPGSSTAGRSGERRLTGGERRELALLALPTLGLALSITVVTTYLPKVAQEFIGSTAVIGLIIGGEGLLALFLPVLVGAWSDRFDSSLGGRLPFLLAAAPVMAAGLVILGFVSSTGALAAAVLLFFGAYFVAYEPYRALYPDLLADEIAGRGQSVQAIARGAGTGLALVAGGLLLAIGQLVPFAVAAAVLMATTGLFAHFLLRSRGVPDQERSGDRDVRQTLRGLRRTVAERPGLRAFLAANALWELSLGAIKTFVVLYITLGLGMSLTGTAGIVGGAAVLVLAGAASAGKLGDRYGGERVMRVAALVYGGLLAVPLLTTEPALVLPVVPVVAFAAGVTMTLPYALLIPRMPAGEHGLLTGFYSLSRGLGTMLGPLLAGVAIELLGGVLDETDGYAAVWGVAGLALLASVPLLRRLERHPAGA